MVHTMSTDIVLSDTFIALGLAGWAICTVTAAITKKKEAAAAVAIAWGVYAWGAGETSSATLAYLLQCFYVCVALLQ